ncbi:MAG: TrkA family potassium uptake protein [Clostridia bacterium]|nr:TrkA family potassium uptake protein [Clostridia bacterium]
MKSFLLIGLGKFGQLLGNELMEMGDEVMVVDKNENIINELAPNFTNAVCANCMNMEVLRGFDIPKFDACIVSIGDDFQSSLEITDHLKELKAKKVIAKASTEIQKKFLNRTGADVIVYPNRDAALALATNLNGTRDYEAFKYTEIDDKFSVTEVPVPPSWKGKSIVKINPRGQGRLNILLVRQGKNTVAAPNGDFVFEEGQTMVVFGETDRIYNLINTNK